MPNNLATAVYKKAKKQGIYRRDSALYGTRAQLVNTFLRSLIYRGFTGDDADETFWKGCNLKDADLRHAIALPTDKMITFINERQ